MNADRSAQTTQLLKSFAAGEQGAMEKLLPLVYDELHRLAEQIMGGEARRHTLQPTALIHEAYVRLVQRDGAEWESRRHFLRVAARAMRYALVDHARTRAAQKRGGDRRQVTLDEGIAGVMDDPAFLLDVDSVLGRLKGTDEQLVQIFEMRFFAGLDNEQIAEALEISTRTVRRGWRLAQAWMLRALEADGEH